MITLLILTTSLIHFPSKSWQNVLFEHGSTCGGWNRRFSALAEGPCLCTCAVRLVYRPELTSRGLNSAAISSCENTGQSELASLSVDLSIRIADQRYTLLFPIVLPSPDIDVSVVARFSPYHVYISLSKVGRMYFLTLPLPRVINVNFPLRPHQKYFITQY